MAHRHGKGWRGSVRVPGRADPLRRGGFTTKKAAEAWERDTVVDHERGTYRDRGAGQVRFDTWAADWLATRGVGKRSAAVAEQSIIRTHLIPAFGTVVLDDLDALLVRKFIAELAQHRAPKTVRNVHAVLFNVLQLAVQSGRLAVNPCAGTPLPKNRRRKPPAFLTEHEVQHLITVMPEAWQPLTTLLATTGLRWGEAVGLRVGRVDLLGGALRVEEAMNEAEGVLTFDAPKSPAAIRTVTLPKRAIDVLVPLIAGRDAGELVFTTSTGLPVRHRNYYSRVWGPAVVKAGLVAKRPSPHDLRHSHAAVLIAAGVPLSAIKERLGHEDITTTDGLYGFLLPQVDQGVLAALDAAFPVGADQMGAFASPSQPVTQEAGHDAGMSDQEPAGDAYDVTVRVMREPGLTRDAVMEQIIAAVSPWTSTNLTVTSVTLDPAERRLIDDLERELRETRETWPGSSDPA